MKQSGIKDFFKRATPERYETETDLQQLRSKLALMDEIDAIATPILAAPISLVERRTKQVRGDDDEDDVGKTETSVVAIPSMMMGGIDVEFTKEPKRKLTKKWNQRPSNWVEIGSYYMQCKPKGLLTKVDLAKAQYGDELAYLTSEDTLYKALNRWAKDVIKGKTEKQFQLNLYRPRVPPYGADVDARLYRDCVQRMDAAIPLNNTILRMLLVEHLNVTNQSNLLEENGGKYRFGSSWAQRFWKMFHMKSLMLTIKKIKISMLK